jgi:hypothetical protein
VAARSKAWVVFCCPLLCDGPTATRPGLPNVEKDSESWQRIFLEKANDQKRTTICEISGWNKKLAPAGNTYLWIVWIVSSVALTQQLKTMRRRMKE